MEAEPIKIKGVASKMPPKFQQEKQILVNTFFEKKKQKHLKFNLYQKAFFIYFFNLVNFIQ